MKTLDSICLALVIIGAIVWGFVGLFNFNVVGALFGASSVLTRIIYIIVGLAGLWALTFFGKLDSDDSHEIHD